MREVALFQPNPNAPAEYHRLADRLKKLSESKGRVYQTFVVHGRINCVLVTTSKDVHLAIGLLERQDHQDLCAVMREEFSLGKNEPLLLHLKDEVKSVLYVTKFHENDTGATYHLSPAN